MSRHFAGISEALLPSPVGEALIGPEQPATGVHDPLRVQALVLGDGTQRVALVCADLVGMDLAPADRIRGRISEKLGIATALINCSHTHSAPYTIPWGGAWRAAPGGLWGTDRAGWLVRHFQGDFYRLGRLQFEFGGFIGGIVMFRQEGSGTVIALAEGGVRFLEDGRLWTEARGAHPRVADAAAPSRGQEGAVGADHSAPAGEDSPRPLRGRPSLEREGGEGTAGDVTPALQSEAWTSELSVTDTEITGHVVTVLGRARRETITLPAGEWRQVLAKGDPVLHLHIAPGSPMDHRECGESFAWAERFFPEHFPHRPFLAYCCNSWLLDTQLAELLPPEANMARFQREMYLFQTITSDENLLRPIYGQIPQFQPSPRNTSLQRTLSDFLEAGGKLRGDGGGSVILREDLDWGGEVYRRGRADERARE